MELPGLGELTRDDTFGWYRSERVALPLLGGRSCPVVLDATRAV
jgi:hypothetical protein